jgi:hypothetical protein
MRSQKLGIMLRFFVAIGQGGRQKWTEAFWRPGSGHAIMWMETRLRSLLSITGPDSGIG